MLHSTRKLIYVFFLYAFFFSLNLSEMPTYYRLLIHHMRESSQRRLSLQVHASSVVSLVTGLETALTKNLVLLLSVQTAQMLSARARNRCK